MLKRKKYQIFLIVVILTALSIWIFLVPVIKFNINYKIPKNQNAQETLEYYFDCLDNNNPGKANTLLVNPTLDIFCCSGVSVKLKSVDELEKVDIDLSSYYDSIEYFVEYDCDYFITDRNKIFEGMSDCSNYYLVKETEDSDWKIHSWGLG